MGQFVAPPYPNPQLTAITTATAEIAAVAADVTDLETAVGTYAGGADLATDVDALQTAVGTYAGGADLATDVAANVVAIGTPATVSTETDLFAICAALEARIVTLETP